MICFTPVKSRVRRAFRATALALTCFAALNGCNEWPAQQTAGFRTLGADLVAENLNNPVFITAPPRDSRMFVVERRGTIQLLSAGGAAPRPFLDASASVSTFGNERGMMSMAFHPRFAQNGQFFVTYVGNDGAFHLDRYRVSAVDANVADAASRTELLNIPTSGIQHYGGMLEFTPEGTLMVSVGEGGTFNEPGGESQNPSSLLGKILRLDVDRGEPYSVPGDNPYVERENFRPEIWAMGLRNPWRFSIDPATRQLYVADVGDYSYEEVNVISLDTGGVNFGWNYYEGRNCQFADFCSGSEYHLPEVQYTHQPPCTSVTGGIVYRGTAHPEHVGRYFYADYCLGWIRSMRFVGGMVTEELDWATSIPSDRIVSFGEDSAHELYAVSLRGRIYRIGGDRSTPPAAAR